MTLYKYENYEEYKAVQEAGNVRKLDGVWVSKKVIDTISDYIKKNMKNVSFGICHGTKRGVEQQLFSDNLGVKVIGTEIASTAEQFPNTIEWDFHNVKDEWINSVDFIYTNALDHSYHPKKAVSRWMKCLNDDGLLFIEHTRRHVKSTRLDPFGATRGFMKRLLNKYGTIIDVLEITGNHIDNNKQTKFSIFVVKKKAVK